MIDSAEDSDAEKMMEVTGVEVTEYPGLIHDCEVEAVLNVDGATHVGGLIGTGLYFFREETIWNAYDCAVKAEMNGAVTPGALPAPEAGFVVTTGGFWPPVPPLPVFCASGVP